MAKGLPTAHAGQQVGQQRDPAPVVHLPERHHAHGDGNGTSDQQGDRHPLQVQVQATNSKCVVPDHTDQERDHCQRRQQVDPNQRLEQREGPAPHVVGHLES